VQHDGEHGLTKAVCRHLPASSCALSAGLSLANTSPDPLLQDSREGEKEAKESANKEKQLTLARSAHIMVSNYSTDLLSDSDCSSPNAITGTADDDSAVDQLNFLPVNCQRF
jgi:hypothetical protein